VLARPPEHAQGELPAVGEDVLLRGEAKPDQVFEVAATKVDGDPAMCELRPLPWHKQKGRKKPSLTRLGGGEGGTTPWASADQRYLLLLDVAAGVARDYGPEEPNLKGGEMPREPAGGYHSVTGTEQDLSVDKLGIPQLVYRAKCPEWRHDLAPLVRDGWRYGCQFAVWRGEQVNPRFLVEYVRKRQRRAGAGGCDDDAGGDGGGSGSGDGSSGGDGGGDDDNDDNDDTDDGDNADDASVPCGSSLLTAAAGGRSGCGSAGRAPVPGGCSAPRDPAWAECWQPAPALDAFATSDPELVAFASRERAAGSEAHVLVAPRRLVRDAAALEAADAPLLEQMLTAATRMMRGAIGDGFEEAELLTGFHWPPRVTVEWLHLHVLYPKVRAAPSPPSPSQQCNPGVRPAE
jgi:hypothetical protein